MTRLLPVLALLLASCGAAPVAGYSPSPPTPSPPAAATAADPCHRGAVTYCALNPAVTPLTVRQTVCVPGWTARVRPPVAYTGALKRRQLQQLHLPGRPADYEEDHRLPLEGGGAPFASQNLTPEPWARAHAKDQAENQLRRDICNGGNLRALQAAFIARWLGPWPTFA